MTMVLMLALTCLGCRQQSAAPTPITVFAAASTTELVNEAAAEFQRRFRVEVRTSFGASSTLARQIEAGAPCDIYLSADPRWVDELQRKGLVVGSTRRDLMTNELVLIAPRGRSLPVRFERTFDFARALPGRLAMADPTHVPAGDHARQALEALGWWKDIEARVLPAGDVRQALRLVEQGEAEAGIVYRTDVETSTRCEVVAAIPANLHEPISYVVAVCRGSAADAFSQFLFSPAVAEMIRRHGFIPIEHFAASLPSASGAGL
jgi:molybdate transport system substrate-binding protein